jgi:hypothetical protein
MYVAGPRQRITVRISLPLRAAVRPRERLSAVAFPHAPYAIAALSRQTRQVFYDPDGAVETFFEGGDGYALVLPVHPELVLL